ncbi:hypothetical protein [Herbidospora galbida]|uniref:hypothetical protein n=1 Tax=Herbidospora galbida TaxID=2575442 RepID=UPI002482494E|nr:hypothetical protein [Herbidospora galbida]
MAGLDEHRGVQLESRRQARLNERFPEVVTALRQHLPPGTVLDGEIVRWSANGRLGRRRAPTPRRRLSPAPGPNRALSLRRLRPAGNRWDGPARPSADRAAQTP